MKLSYWTKFHVNIITDSGVVTIFFYMGFDQKSGIRKYPHLNFAQYQESGAGWEYQIWYECL